MLLNANNNNGKEVLELKIKWQIEKWCGYCSENESSDVHWVKPLSLKKKYCESRIKKKAR